MTPRFRRRLASSLVAALVLVGTVGVADAADSGGHGESSSGMGRDDVSGLAGQYILLDPLWVRVKDTSRERFYYRGLLVRLEPDPARKVDACYAVPDIVDALVIDFYENPMTREDYKRYGHAAKRVQDVVDRVAGKSVFGVPQVFEQIPEMDDNSIKLSRICQ